MKTVVVFGGGIAGLTAAHELAVNGYKVILIEKEAILGGMAAGKRNNGVPSECSWRAFGAFYKNFDQVAKRIPISSKKTVYNNLTIPVKQNVLYDNPRRQYTPSLIDKFVTWYYTMQYTTSNNRRYEFHKTNLMKFLDSSNFASEDLKFELLDRVGANNFGFERDKVSMGSILRLPLLCDTKYMHTHKLDNNTCYKHAYEPFHLLNQPINEAWFNPWESYLKKEGVEFIKQSSLYKIHYDGNHITSCDVIDANNNITRILCDEYVLCINPFTAEQVFNRSRKPHYFRDRMTDLFIQHSHLNNGSMSIQVGMMFGFKNKIKLTNPKEWYIMANSEFNITFYPCDYHWDKNVYLGDNIQSLWNITASSGNVKGNLYNKPMHQLTKDELLNEVIHQLIRSKDLQKIIYKNNGRYLTKEDITYKHIWHEWNNKNGLLLQDNYKWGNTSKNQEFRPGQTTSYDNLYLGGAHTKTTIDIWCMEGAVESGKRVADSIIKNDKVYIYSHNDPEIFKPLKAIDDTLYAVNLPNVFVLLLFIIIIIIMSMLYKTFNNKPKLNIITT